MITPQLIIAITGNADIKTVTEIANALNDTITKYSINTPLRISHFLAQLLHESGNFKFLRENLNYSVKGLLTTFPKYFINEAAATPYARNQEMIANRVYGGRMGNGDEKSGDGFKFRGRGYIQITGKNNYTALSNDLKIDFLSKPELLETIQYAALSAGWFWNKNGLNALADKDDVLGVTRRINGGVIGLQDRIDKLNNLKKLIQ